MPRGKKKKRVVEASPPPVRGRKRRGRAISHSPVRSPISPSSQESTHSEEAEMAEQNNRNVSDYATPKLDGLQHIWGSPIEDPNNHILNFLEICDTFKNNGVSDDAIRLRLFPFSLRDKAKVWLQSLPEGSISTWEELAQQFLTKYFPPGKTANMRNDITSFVLLDNESLYEAWERFKELLRKSGRALISKPIDAAYTLLETMSFNNHQWHSDRHVHARVAGVQDSDMFASLSSQIAVLTKEVKSLGIQGAIKAVSPFVQPCENYGESHTLEQCPLVLESVQFLANRNANNPYSNTYNPGWRNHPNFSWSQNQGTGPSSSATHPNYPHELPPPVENKSSLEEMMMSYMSKNDALMQSLEEASPTTIMLQMADRSIAYPRGIIENVLVKVDKLILPADFIVLDYEEDKNVPIILGRPFLATRRTIIDVQKGELTMRVQDQEDDELKYHLIDPNEVFKYPYAETCDVDFVGCAKILEAPPWKIRAPPWCHKPSPSYSREQDWTFMQGANVVAKQGPNAQRVKLPRFKETQWSIKKRIRMAYLEEQTQHLTACNGVIHQNFREFVKYTNGDKLDPHYQDLQPPPKH
ncbi:uncharacterized protein G2W53_004713 [Senna tora]|uniref:Retrotransposon gag domain-containing protein n=1 Tax=Senna tora TaxID=362788 RepID=A0A835CJK9_9FABA|nr:uncharacterized protein G2W53_004713 [Senna tora]